MENISEPFTDEFKDLIENMLEKDPKKRYTMKEVANSKWIAGNIASQNEIELFFN